MARCSSIDEIVTFRPLGVEPSAEIVRLAYHEIAASAQEKYGVTVTLSDDALRHLVASGCSPEHGTRGLQRLVAVQVRLPLSRHLLNDPDGSRSLQFRALEEQGPLGELVLVSLT
ncbi:MAG: hypothetical protein ACYC6T_17890 [Thermoleophilia bacterium]